MTATTTAATPRPGRQAGQLTGQRTAMPARPQAVWVTVTDAAGRERPELRWVVAPSAGPAAVPHAA